MRKIEKKGDKESFDKNWRSRNEAHYIHWTRGEPQNQIQLAFSRHWSLFREIMGEMPKCKRVLEVGCGRGSMSAFFADNGYDCTLLDSSESVINTARDIFGNLGFNAAFDVGDALDLPYNDNSFDVVFSIGLLEHFKEINTLLSEQIRILDQGGLFLGYVVPEYTENIQKNYSWINDILKILVGENDKNEILQKEAVYRSDSASKKYIEVLEQLPVHDIKASGVYPLPMISYSPEFPFTLLNPEAEKVLVKYFQAVLAERYQTTGVNAWLCDEGYGQAFLIWCFKN